MDNALDHETPDSPPAQGGGKAGRSAQDRAEHRPNCERRECKAPPQTGDRHRRYSDEKHRHASDAQKVRDLGFVIGGSNGRRGDPEHPHDDKRKTGKKPESGTEMPTLKIYALNEKVAEGLPHQCFAKQDDRNGHHADAHGFRAQQARIDDEH